MQHAVFDTVTLKDGRKFYGIVDYVSTKQIYFFDFTTEVDIDYIILAILWRGNTETLRFSVFSAIEYPTVRLPRAILIPISGIEECSVCLKKTKPQKSQKTLVTIRDH